MQGWLLLSVGSFEREQGVSCRDILSGWVRERDGVRGWVLLSEQLGGEAHRVSRGIFLRGDVCRACDLSRRELLRGWGDRASAVHARELLPRGSSKLERVPGRVLLPELDSEDGV